MAADNSSQSVTHLIVDSGAFIRNAKVEKIGADIYSVPEVPVEIKDKSTRERLQVLPYQLHLISPKLESLTAVTEFAKKTGDFPSLSATDLKVLALTHQLHLQYCSEIELRNEPVLSKQVVLENKEFAAGEVAGFYVPNKTVASLSSASKATESDQSGSCGDEQDTTTTTETSEATDSTGSESDDEENGWITPANYRQIANKMTGGEAVVQNVTVGCITTDFAMQNVLMHMGLKVISLDGLLIRNLKNYVLRCYGCFNTTSHMTSEFCKNCGNKTLQKVTVTVNTDGTTSYHLSRRKAPNIRGLKYSLPAPQGGKHAVNPVLVEDQRHPDNRQPKKSLQKLNVFDDDYEARSSPFMLKDVTSRAAVLGIRNLGLREKNPNAGHKGRKRGGKKR